MSTTYTVEIDTALAARLEEAARTAQVSAADLISNCVEQHMEVALRHRVLMDRLEAVDQGLLELATFIGEATAGSSLDLSDVCQYARSKA
jgi:predicted transcriptional regulator